MLLVKGDLLVALIIFFIAIVTSVVAVVLPKGKT